MFNFDDDDDDNDDNRIEHAVDGIIPTFSGYEMLHRCRLATRGRRLREELQPRQQSFVGGGGDSCRSVGCLHFLTIRDWFGLIRT